MSTAILFDLDGTLLPMDNDEFIHRYFKGLAAKLVPHGYDPKELVDGVWAGTAAMVKNDGSRRNDAAFWDTFAQRFPNLFKPEHRDVTDDFYTHEFHNVKTCTGENPLAKPLIDALKSRGLRVALATNPVFPLVAVEARLSWIGLSLADFELVTCYENSRFSKPNPAYFTDVADALGISPAECIMVGNNVDEDALAAQKAGMRTVLVTDCLINEHGADLAAFTTTDFAHLETTLAEML